MKAIKKISLLAVLISAGVSCCRVAEEKLPSGYLSVCVEQDSRLVPVKSAQSGDAVFSLTVFDKSGTKVADYADYHEIAGAPLELPMGSYSVASASGEVPSAAFDSPVWAGTTEFTLKPDIVNTVDVTCTLANIKVTAEFSDEIKSDFQKYELTVSNGEGTLVFSSEDGTAGNDGYFSVTDRLEWKLALVNRAGGTYTMSDAYTNPSARQHYNLKFSLAPKADEGKTGIRLVVDNSLNVREHELVLDFSVPYDPSLDTDGSIVAISASPWAMFAQLNGKWLSETAPAGLGFEYKKKSDEEWTAVNAASIVKDEAKRTFSAEVRGLEPSTDYVFRAVSDDEHDTTQRSFATEAAAVIPNMSFDSWCQKNGKIWYANESLDNIIFDSANGSGMIIGTMPEETDVAVAGSGKKACKMESKTAMGSIFAAGNIYTGQFDQVSGIGAKLKWGYPFTSRPLALKGYYKYSPKTIDYAKNPYTEKKGQTDECSIIVLLTDWPSQFDIDTNSEKFVDYENDEHIIAMGSLYSSNTDSEYVPFTLKLDYRDRTRIPTYAVVVCSSSRYGDYFTGGKGSVLLIDEFDFIYDPDEL